MPKSAPHLKLAPKPLQIEDLIITVPGNDPRGDLQTLMLEVRQAAAIMEQVGERLGEIRDLAVSGKNPARLVTLCEIHRDQLQNHADMMMSARRDVAMHFAPALDEEEQLPGEEVRS